MLSPGDQRDEVILDAPAKINLFLKILGRRPDGYHDLQSLMVKVDLSDRLRLWPIDSGIQFEFKGNEVPDDSSNLVWKAAKLFYRHTGIPEGVAIQLEKNIPVAAGLGGGSSDGAAVLLALNQLHGGGLSENTLADLGKRLGADVPFFIRPYSVAYAQGVGDRLTQVSGLGHYEIVLVNPGFSVSTKWAFETFALTSKVNPYILAPEWDYPASTSTYLREIPKFPVDVAVMANDLEKATIPHHSVVGEIKAVLQKCGALLSLMSGSGPTVFGVFPDHDRAVAGFEICCRNFGKMVYLTKPLP
ncbi:MAG: 4-(cytidine 5'-diphospho)-2-C-methyl-D-erythritol kinase [Proteobacteria bacterium]|nr:4-(cytidine 5'-diphospho)-2-C-methyl-D-erythritol kinase [Pseudomonadota bacterium]